jgi:hypothetical protein
MFDFDSYPKMDSDPDLGTDFDVFVWDTLVKG